MDRTGHKFLAGAGFADDEHWTISSRCRMNPLKDCTYRRTLSYQFLETIALLELRT
jgi:hypothetical protein